MSSMATRVVARFNQTGADSALGRETRKGLKALFAKLSRVTGYPWKLNQFSSVEPVEDGRIILDIYEEQHDRGGPLGLSGHLIFQVGDGPTYPFTWRFGGWLGKPFAKGSGKIPADQMGQIDSYLSDFVTAIGTFARSKRPGVESDLMQQLILKNSNRYLKELEARTGVKWSMKGSYAPEDNLRTIHFMQRTGPRSRSNGLVVTVSFYEDTGHSLSWLYVLDDGEVWTGRFDHLDPEDVANPSKFFDNLKSLK